IFAKISKMWHKLGTWLWLATQNLKDYPDTAEKMLNMVEWWICLTMPPDEIEHIDGTDRGDALYLVLTLNAGLEKKGE
ncbi:hypothetical protein, partial [Aeromonas hydrophila]